MRTGKILAIFGLIASTFAVFLKIMTPTTVQFIVDGSVIKFTNIPAIYGSSDMVVIGISCFVMGSSLIYLWFGSVGFKCHYCSFRIACLDIN